MLDQGYKSNIVPEIESKSKTGVRSLNNDNNYVNTTSSGADNYELRERQKQCARSVFISASLCEKLKTFTIA